MPHAEDSSAPLVAQERHHRGKDEDNPGGPGHRNRIAGALGKGGFNIDD